MAAANDETPYATLTPDVVLDAVESVGLRCDGRVLALNSYENRVYRIGIEDAAPLVAKFYRPARWSDAAIEEEHAFGFELLDADIDVVCPLRLDSSTLHRHAGFRFALFPMRGGHAPEADDRETLRHLGRVLGRWHAVGARTRFAHRAQLDVDSFGEEPLDCLHANAWVPAALEQAFFDIAEALLTAIRAAWTRAGSFRTLRIHGDFHPGNILWRDDAACFVDLDDCLTGPAMQDLWMLLSGSPDDMRRQLGWLLEGYGLFNHLDLRELQLIEALRGLRLIHYHAWIARRWHDPAFPLAFPWFGQPRHWEAVITQMQEQLSALQEEPLQAP